MRNGIVLIGLLLLAGCQSIPSVSPTKGESDFWYDAGYKDATSGIVVRDNETLSEWFGNPDVDRHAYLNGYRAGQTEWCHPDNVAVWGRAGKPFPAGCDGVNDAEKLKKVWQHAVDESTSHNRSAD
ncbi:DUF2799 domain-containing protein [Dickeya fangzhongdai]|uniref:DUF2799 domain-containing protein n=1 Tax=Dickeya fangzhongdai TaxID=1778540 RepID=UPI0004F8E10B|nr:DUF2799 domain-containing protein [Dickeya fangzhongdai]AIR70997.1 hypothetical protein LH89_17925 [Dickeya fangzhongdai]KGT97184.1 hypothetical protein NM75_16590 [Dickeya fangzhongdai]KHN56738.1 hypothetical protein OI70_12140 [Dickeya fangzhongdai]